MPDRLPSYSRILEALDELPTAVRVARRMRGLSLRQAAEEMGIAFVNIDRFEARKTGYNSATLRAILVWLDRQSAPAEESTDA